MSRARRIAQYLYDHPKGAGISQIRASADPDATFGTIGAQLAQLIEAGKVHRTGAGRSAMFFPTATVLVDKRSTKPTKATKAKAVAKPAPAPKAPTPVAAAPKPHRERSRHFAAPKPRIASANAAPETVEEFLARGGRIQYCEHGERGLVPMSYRDQSQAHKERVRADAVARHKAKPRNQIDPDDDVDDLDAAA